MIAVVNYGLGNVKAFVNIYHRLGIPATTVSTADELGAADKIVLPGVGAFDWAMTLLNESGMRECLDDLVLRRDRPVLGVCVGMQIMARRSGEGKLPGLGWIDGEVVRFDTEHFNQRTHLPHMGWNDVEPTATDTLFREIEAPRYYFLHSYYIVPADPECALSTTDYGVRFASSIRRASIFGTQFHPEKSHDAGIQLLRNFAEM